MSEQHETRIHGGISEWELQRLALTRDDILDLSVNVNPWGPHPEVSAAVQRAALEHYPQPRAARACAALARNLGEDEARIIVGHGSTELLWSAVGLLRGNTRPLLCVGPTFSEPLSAARAQGVPCVEWRTRAEELFRLDLSALDRAIQEQNAAAVYICQPNNPDGGVLPAARLAELCASHPERFFIVDQAFLSLCERHADVQVRFGDNVIVVRSLTKEHALPGLRIGYALAAPALIERLHARRPSWMVSTLAEAAVVATCEHGAYVDSVRMRLLEGRRDLADGCLALGLSVIPSQAHFFLIRVTDADAARQRLLARHKLAVRSCSSFGLPDYVRVAGCVQPARTRALAALAAELCS